jgi:hypothetical protein
LAGTGQGLYERAYQRGLDGFRSNAEDAWEEGEGAASADVPQHVAISLTPKFVGQVTTISA